jgi:hypothetical protein
MAFGAFGPWVTALGASVAGTDGSNDGWFVLGAAVLSAIALLAFRHSPGRWKVIGILIFGGISTYVTIHDRQNVGHAINSSGNALVRSLVHVGWGLTLAMVASISLVVAALSLFGIGPLTEVDAPSAEAPTHRECPHCKEPMRRDASVCPHCQRDSEPWTLNDGAWWVERDGVWNHYDETSGEWVPAPAASADPG